MVHSGLESAHHIGPEWCPCNWDSITTLEPFRQQSQQHTRVVSNQASGYQNQLQIFWQPARMLETPQWFTNTQMHKNCNQTNKSSKSEKSERNLTWELSHPEKVSTLLAHKCASDKINPWPPHKRCFFYFASTLDYLSTTDFKRKIAVTRLAGSSKTWNDPQN